MSNPTSAVSNQPVAEVQAYVQMVDLLNPSKGHRRPDGFLPIELVNHLVTGTGLELEVNRPPIGDMPEAMQSMIEKLDSTVGTVTVTAHEDKGRHYFLVVFS